MQWPLIVPCLPYVRLTSPRRIWMVHPFLTVPCSAVLPAMLRISARGGTCWPTAKSETCIKKKSATRWRLVNATNSDLPNEVHVNHAMCVSLYIYIHIMFRLRPCCSHFLKEDWIIINHNPWIRKRTNELYKRRHCFVKVCCDSSQKQARKTCRQRSLNPRLVATTEAPHSHHSRTFKSQVF